ncbi:hypothetical protein [Microcoleus sp. B13-B6]|uniref:hypothetical protein n=1 Tax=Microcoleus sp. B13-B6 TaxID=2818652 RepID=UPI002FD36C05
MQQLSVVNCITAPSLEFFHQQLPTPHHSELRLPPSDYQELRSAISIVVLTLS